MRSQVPDKKTIKINLPDNYLYEQATMILNSSTLNKLKSELWSCYYTDSSRFFLNDYFNFIQRSSSHFSDIKIEKIFNKLNKSFLKLLNHIEGRFVFDKEEGIYKILKTEGEEKKLEELNLMCKEWTSLRDLNHQFVSLGKTKYAKPDEIKFEIEFDVENRRLTKGKESHVFQTRKKGNPLYEIFLDFWMNRKILRGGCVLSPGKTIKLVFFKNKFDLPVGKINEMIKNIKKIGKKFNFEVTGKSDLILVIREGK
ncbi:MAG: hypothetical protein WCF92_02015 [bacterium]